MTTKSVQNLSSLIKFVKIKYLFYDVPSIAILSGFYQSKSFLSIETPSVGLSPESHHIPRLY